MGCSSQPAWSRIQGQQGLPGSRTTQHTHCCCCCCGYRSAACWPCFPFGRLLSSLDLSLSSCLDPCCCCTTRVCAQADQLHHDARPQQRQEAHGCECQLFSCCLVSKGFIVGYNSSSSAGVRRGGTACSSKQLVDYLGGRVGGRGLRAARTAAAGSVPKQLQQERQCQQQARQQQFSSTCRQGGCRRSHSCSTAPQLIRQQPQQSAAHRASTHTQGLPMPSCIQAPPSAVCC